MSTLPTSSYSGAPVTGDAQPQLLLTFTEAVVGLKPGSFNVTLETASADTSPAHVRAVQPANNASNGTGSASYVLQLVLPPAYTGAVNITLQVRGVEAR